MVKVLLVALTKDQKPDLGAEGDILTCEGNLSEWDLQHRHFHSHMPAAKKVHHVTAEQCLSEKCSVVICAPITSKPGKLLMYGLNHVFVNVPDGECIQICSKASDSHDILFPTPCGWMRHRLQHHCRILVGRSAADL